jgi:hypothetical protein
MSIRSRAFNLIIAIWLLLILPPGAPTAAPSPFPQPVDREQPQANRVASEPVVGAVNQSDVTAPAANAGWEQLGDSASGGGISDNYGFSWTPSLAVAPDLTPYVAWANASNGDFEIYVRRWNGSSWEEVGTGSASGGGISSNTEDSYSPSVAISPDGIAYVAWHDSSGGDTEIYVRRWNGSSWEEVGTGSATGGGISDNSGSSGRPVMAVAPDGTVYVAWEDYSDGDSEIYVRRWRYDAWEQIGGSASGGGISNNSGSSEFPSVAVAADGTPYIAWSDSSGGGADIYVRRWKYGTWDQIGSSASGGGISDSGYSACPSVAIAPDHAPYVAWHDSSGEDSEIYVRRWNGSSWEEVGTGSATGGGVSDNSENSDLPSMAVALDGTPFVAWQDGSFSSEEIYVRHWDGYGWEEVGTGSAAGGGISDSGGSVLNPAMAFAPDGTPYVAWEDYSGGDSEIYLRRKICPLATIRSAGSGDWSDASTWDLNRVPNEDDVVHIQEGHMVTSPESINVQGLYNYGVLQSPSCQSSGFHIACRPLPSTRFRWVIRVGWPFANVGQLVGGNGVPGVGTGCGGNGWSIDLRSTGPFFNAGTIRGGAGGGASLCGGAAGWVRIQARNTTNAGTIRGGGGGHLSGSGAGRAGDGGSVEVWGKWEGPGFVSNTGTIVGGGGGDGNPAQSVGPQQGGNGGSVCVVSLPQVFLFGVERGGRGGRGTGGGARGRIGDVDIEPNIISLSGGEARVSGEDVVIFGGDDWVLDLSNMAGASVTATHDITLAVGSGGAVDLRGNTSQVLQAGGRVFIASDVISLEVGVDLADVVGTNVTTDPSQILYDFSLAGPGYTTGQPGVTLPVVLTLLNGGPMTDTYTLSRSDSAGWDLGALSSPITVGGIDGKDLAMNVTPPSDAEVGDTDVITITATSQADADLVAVAVVQVAVGAKETRVHLPLTMHNYSSPPIYFDDFSDANSGWPVRDETNYATDYSDGNYRIQVKVDNLAVWARPGFVCSDCTIEVEAWRSTGGSSRYGIAFGLDSSGGQGYFYQIQPYVQQYRLLRYDSGTWATLIPFTDSPHIAFDTAHNKLRVTRVGSQIQLYVNDHHLASCIDSTYSGTRYVGVYAGSGPESPVWLRYDNFTVWGQGHGTMAAGKSGVGGLDTAIALPEQILPID